MNPAYWVAFIPKGLRALQHLEITDAQVSLANARADYIQALYNYKIAGSKIENAIGTFR